MPTPPHAPPDRVWALQPEPGGVRILVVDDDEVDRLAVRRCLRDTDLHASFAEVGTLDEAEKTLSRETFHCVLLDFLLPDGNGLELVQRLRKSGVRTPIIILTGQGDESVAVELMKAGASDYLPKSAMGPERLRHAIRNTLRLHRAEEQVDIVERERARLLVMEQAAREEADVAHRRLAFLAEAGTLVSASLDYATTLETVARLAVPILADWCFVDLGEPDGTFERVAAAHKDPDEAVLAAGLQRRYAPLPDAPHGISRVLATGRSEVMTHIPDWFLISTARDAEHLELLRQMGGRSYMCVPLAARGRILGAMTFITCGDTPYSLADLAFAEEIARRAALAVDNARLYQEARAAEERLRHQLDFTSTITDSLGEGVCAFDVHGRFTFLNPAAEAILGVATGSLLGKGLEEALCDGAMASPLLRAIRSGGMMRNDDATFTRWDGLTVPVAFACSPIVSNGRLIGSVLAFHDITERKKAEEELEASRRRLTQSEKLSALGTLVSGVAHELRTPLTYISNNLFLLQARLEAAARENAALAPIVAETARFRESALEGVERISALVKDLRPFANAEGGRRASADLRDVVAQAVELYRVTARGRVEVDAQLDPTGVISLDKGQIQRVLINLLVNAAEAMPQGGIVHVRTRAARGGAEVEVRDHGTGIPSSVEGRIFDPFFTTKADGTGLGLSITRGIVEAHGGSIRYDTKQGEGTTFYVFLPVEGLPVPVKGGADAPRLPAP